MSTMQQKTFKGWVVMNPKHPHSGKELIIGDTFAFTKRESIIRFLLMSSFTWEYVHKELNYKAVKAVCTIEVKNW